MPLRARSIRRATRWPQRLRSLIRMGMDKSEDGIPTLCGTANETVSGANHNRQTNSYSRKLPVRELRT